MGYCFYNGVKLPDINTVWTDKEAYPVAVIHDYGGDSPIASLTLCGCDYDGDVPVPRVNTDGSPRSIMTYDYESFPWQLFHLYSMENGWVLDVSGRNDAPSLWSELIWSNVDCEYVGEPYAYLPSGKVYLAASDPVPQLNPAALMQGFFVGEAVKRNRK